MDLQDLVRGYYGSGGLTEAVLGALSSAGIDVDHFTPADLFLVDHLHAGGAGATEHVLNRLRVGRGLRLLDVGRASAACTDGGDAWRRCDEDRPYAGIVETATELSARVGLADNVRFVAISGESLPFDDKSFDAAMMVHVGMNIPVKKAVFTEMHRVWHGVRGSPCTSRRRPAPVTPHTRSHGPGTHAPRSSRASSGPRDEGVFADVGLAPVGELTNEGGS